MSEYRKNYSELDRKIGKFIEDVNNDAILRTLYEIYDMVNPNNKKPRLCFSEFNKLMLTDDKPLIL